MQETTLVAFSCIDATRRDATQLPFGKGKADSAAGA
jgi:hypothetical protein